MEAPTFKLEYKNLINRLNFVTFTTFHISSNLQLSEDGKLVGCLLGSHALDDMVLTRKLEGQFVYGLQFELESMVRSHYLWIQLEPQHKGNLVDHAKRNIKNTIKIKILGLSS